MKKRGLALIAFLLGTGVALAQPQDPHPQPIPGPSVQCDSADGVNCDSVQPNPADIWTIVTTPQGKLPVGQNFLLTVDADNVDSQGNVIVNTDPSSISTPFDPDAPLWTFYNLMDGAPVITSIDTTSPADDLLSIITSTLRDAKNGNVDSNDIKMAIDILEGNPIPSRPTYSGIPMLHYLNGTEVKPVVPIYDSNHNVVGGNVTVHQIWFGQTIESDTAFIDPSAVWNVPWEITYVVDVLHRGEDDLSPYTMYFDAPPLVNGNPPPIGTFGPPKVAMDATFFPMKEGTEFTTKIKMGPGKYFNLVYTWGWRWHPPRVQVMEDALKVMGGQTLPQWEQSVFGADPRNNKAAAIAMIGELSPAKRMWTDFTQAAASAVAPAQVVALMKDAQLAYADWNNRDHLPSGVLADPNADFTLFFVNNTIYGSSPLDLTKWTERPATFNIALLNGDHFMHGYMNVDFGGARGWENQFQNAGGSGCGFTFGRDYWWINAGGPWGAINVPPASADGTTVGVHKVKLTLNFDPPFRLRLYNFDPIHHANAIFSLH